MTIFSCVRCELFRREGDPTRDAAGGRSGFEMDAIYRRRGCGRRLLKFERADNFIFPQRGEQFEDEFRRLTLGKGKIFSAGRARLAEKRPNNSPLNVQQRPEAKIPQRSFIMSRSRVKFSATVRKTYHWLDLVARTFNLLPS